MSGFPRLPQPADQYDRRNEAEFRRLLSAYLSSVRGASVMASDVVSGILPVVRGGTGADLSLTGGAGQVVKQSLVGGAFSVGTLPFADLVATPTTRNGYGITDVYTKAEADALFLDAAEADALFLTPAEGNAAYSALGHTHPTADIVSGTFADLRIAESNVTQHQAALALAASQITSGTFADLRIAQSNVTQHQAALTLSASQTTSGTFADLRIAQSNVTQHQAALTLAASQTTSGVFDVARLGTGTPDGTKFLRDDGTFVVPPGGGGAVDSVFGRTGAVVAASGDYTFAQLASTPTTISGYGITDFNSLGDARWLKLTGGTLTGALLFSADNTLDIGADAATRPRTLYLGTQGIAPSWGNSKAALDAFPGASALFETQAKIMRVGSGGILQLGRVNGSFAAPTATLINDSLGAMAFLAYDGTAWASNGVMTMNATENWAVGAHGMSFSFAVIPNGTTTITNTLILGQDLSVNLPTSSSVLKINGTKVVGVQGAAVANSSATVSSVSTQLNLLLARLRASTGHGLIA